MDKVTTITFRKPMIQNYVSIYLQKCIKNNQRLTLKIVIL